MERPPCSGAQNCVNNALGIVMVAHLIRSRSMKLTVIVTVMVVVLTSLRLEAAVDRREMEAREAFAVGHYQDALELFAKLYAEKLHPNYLRNIGRCYQNLGDPDKAISSFREYLRKAKGVLPSERREIDGYIKEMEDLKLQRQGADTAAPAAVRSASPGADRPVTPAEPPIAARKENAPAPAPAPSLPRPVSAVATPSTPPGVDLTRGRGPAAPSDEANPIYERWWFWAIIGGVAAVGLGAAAAAGVFTKSQDASCPVGTSC